MVTSRETGQVESELLYGPYGELLGTKTGSTYTPLTGYTGHVMQDATGLIYMRGRYYSPVWHRFVNSDQGVDPMSFNQMAYVGGDPLGATDPSGMVANVYFTLGGRCFYYSWESGGDKEAWGGEGWKVHEIDCANNGDNSGDGPPGDVAPPPGGGPPPKPKAPRAC